MKEREGLNPGRKHRICGQALVEFAVVLPVLLLMVFVLIEFSRLFHAYLAAENGARQGIRYAVTGEYENDYCAGPGPACENEAEEQAARLESIREVVHTASETVLRDDSAASHDPGYFKTTICVVDDENRYIPPDPQDPLSSASCSGGEDAGNPGDLVSVTVDFNHPLIIPGLADAFPVLHLHSRREAIVEDFRTNREVSLPPILDPEEPDPPDPDPVIPDCGKLTMSESAFDGSALTAVFRNTNDENPALVFTEVRKGNPMSENLHYTYLYFPYTRHGVNDYWHESRNYADSIAWSGSVPWPGGTEVVWGADLTGDKPRFGILSSELRFRFTDGTECTYNPYLEVEMPEDIPEEPDPVDPDPDPDPPEPDPDPPEPDPPDPPEPDPPEPPEPPPPDPGD